MASGGMRFKRSNVDTSSSEVLTACVRARGRILHIGVVEDHVQCVAFATFVCTQRIAEVNAVHPIMAGREAASRGDGLIAATGILPLHSQVAAIGRVIQLQGFTFAQGDIDHFFGIALGVGHAGRAQIAEHHQRCGHAAGIESERAAIDNPLLLPPDIPGATFGYRIVVHVDRDGRGAFVTVSITNGVDKGVGSIPRGHDARVGVVNRIPLGVQYEVTILANHLAAELTDSRGAGVIASAYAHHVAAIARHVSADHIVGQDIATHLLAFADTYKIAMGLRHVIHDSDGDTAGGPVTLRILDPVSK
ncbi:hypothetical protein D3C81_1063910 [compost metagenome]